MQRDGERVVLCWPPHSLAGSRPCVAPSGRRAVGKRWVVIGDATDGFPRERGSGHHWLLAELGVEAGVMAAGGVGLSARRGSKLEDESERRAQGAASAGSSERRGACAAMRACTRGVTALAAWFESRCVVTPVPHESSSLKIVSSQQPRVRASTCSVHSARQRSVRGGCIRRCR